MLKNYLKVTIRNILRNKLFSAINILGLSISLASCLLLFLYAQKELSYDTAHGDDLYRITGRLSQKDGEEMYVGSSSVPIAQHATEAIPEITIAARMTGSTFFQSKDMITFEDQAYYIENGFVADSTVFDVFNFPVIAGNADKPLTHSNAAVLDKETAIKLFGNFNEAVGKTVGINTILGQYDYEVTAIIDNDQVLSHIEPTFLISTLNTPYAQFFNRFSNQWVSNNLVLTYIKLQKDADPLLVEEKLHELFLENGAEEMKAMGLSKRMYLQPIHEVHTSTEMDLDIAGKVSMTFIRVLIAIGILTLALACFNYINLSTAQAAKRSLEVGIRKALGVTSQGLRFQFLGESFLIVLISSVISVLVALLVLPYFNALVATPVSIGWENAGVILTFSAAFLILTAIVAGAYPALYLSGFNPALVLKGKGADQASSRLRKVLVAAQFVISITLISAILIISRQVDYLKNKELGFSSENKIVLPLTTEEAQNGYPGLKDKFNSLAMIDGVSASYWVPGSNIVNDMLLYKDGQSMENAIHIYNNTVDLNYTEFMDIEILAGQQFTNYNNDTTLAGIIMINLEAADQLNLTPEEAVGEALYFDFRGERYVFRVQAVVENINQFSLHQEVSPLMFQLGGERNYGNLIVQAKTMDDFQQTLEALEAEWKILNPNTPFEYFTLDDHLSVQYAADYNTFSLIKGFAVLSLVISCLGLYALSMFIAERRFKEIGVRKALGASVNDILLLVTRDLSLLIILAFFISIPISIYGMSKWLETFAYRITPGVSTYMTAAIISVVIGWLTIGYQSYRAAKTNPVNVLRDE